MNDDKNKYYTEIWDRVNTQQNGRKGRLTTENIFKFADELVKVEKEKFNEHNPQIKD